MSKKKLFKNIASVGAIQVANYLFPMLSIPIISRIIGPENLGIINLATAFIAYFTLFIGFGFDTTALRRISGDPSNKELRSRVFSEVFTTQCLLLTISALAFLMLLFTVPAFYQEKQVAVFTFITCFATVMTQGWLFQAMQDLPKAAILNLVSKIIFTIIVLLLVREKQDYIWQPLALSLSQVAMAVISFVWAFRRYELKLLRVKIRDCLALLLSENMFFFSLCMINLYTTANIIILGVVQNPLEVGYFTAGQKLITIIQMIITIPLSQVFFPHIGKAFAESFQKGIMVVQKLIPIVFMLTFLFGVAILVGSPWFIRLFYGQQYLQAIAVCRILAFVPMFIAIGTVFGVQVMLNLKMDKAFFIILCIGGGVGLILNLWLVQVAGYIGAAYALAIVQLLVMTLLYTYLRRKGIILINRNFFTWSFYRSFIKSPVLNKYLS